MTGVYYNWYAGEFEQIDGEWVEISGYYDYVSDMNAPTQRFFYDGQMGMEDDSQWQTMNTFPNPPTQHHTVMRYGLGARGIDRMEFTNDSSSTSFAYPMYDGHGNMRAVINKSGSSYSTSNWRTYDVWGSVRTQSTSGDPKQRYCANLGHVADDETDLIYMRARYYEPNSGRFLSEDPAMDGLNWFAYATNDPLTYRDYSGRQSLSDIINYSAFQIAMAATGAAIVFAMLGPKFNIECFGACAVAAICWAIYFGGRAPNELLELGVEALIGNPLMKALVNWTADVIFGLRTASYSLAFKAVAALFAYTLAIWGALLGTEAIDEWSKKRK